MDSGVLRVEKEQSLIRAGDTKRKKSRGKLKWEEEILRKLDGNPVVGVKVRNRKRGHGVIVRIDTSEVTVAYENIDPVTGTTEKRYHYPSSFIQGTLVLDLSKEKK